MRSVLLGAVDSTAAALRVMVEEGAAPVLVAALPPSEASRHSDYVDVGALAREAGCPLLEVSKTNDDAFRRAVAEAEADYLFVIGWSRIVGADVLAVPRHGAIGFHPAALPANRGRAVIPWTILQRAKTTGASLFWIDEGVDSGPLLAQRLFEVAPDETAATLYQKHLVALEAMLRDSIPALRAFSAPRVEQDASRATWCARRTADDALIDWHAPADDVWTLIRATGKPYPGAFTFRGDRRLVIWDAALLSNHRYIGLPGQVQELSGGEAIIACGDGRCVVARSVQLAGDRVKPAAAVLKRHERLGFDVVALYERMSRSES